jgi:hypothetical protein
MFFPLGAMSVCIPSHDAASLGKHCAFAVLHWNFASQSASLAHDLPHVAPAQTYGVHAEVTASAHCPFWLQLPGAIATPAVHEASRHGVAAPTKPMHDIALTPSQLAVLHTFPLDATAHATRPLSGAPTTGTQLPAAAFVLHASHCPVHGVLQQTPSTQNVPTGHAALLVQAWPSASRAVHVPALQ